MSMKNTTAPQRRIRRTRAQRGDSRGSVNANTVVFEVNRSDSRANTSRQIDDEDYFALGTSAITARTWIAPPFDPRRMYEVAEENNTIPPVIDAYVTNVVKTGWSLEPSTGTVEMSEDEKDEALSFIQSPNTSETLETVLSGVIADREYTGTGYIECIRDTVGRLSLLKRAKAIHTRFCPRIDEEVEVVNQIQRGKRISYIREFRKFRRFIQIVHGEVRYFKEFGDPRKMNRVTGYMEYEAGYQPGQDATEILAVPIQGGNSPYGIPRWVNQLPSVLGSRKSEMVNLNYFEDNTIPPMMLLVSGGRLTASSYKNLTNLLSSNGLGRERQNKIVLVEATGQGDSLDGSASPVDLKIEKLNDTRQSDALFQDYDKSNQAKIRSSWRMPAIVLGASTDTNYANAQVSTFVAESQVFGPARDELDELLNKHLFNGSHGLKLSTLRLKGRIPAINSPETVIKTLTALNVMGAVTPRSAQEIANQVLQNELTPYPKEGEEGYEEWMDTPISLTMRKASGRAPEGDTTHDEQRVKTDDLKSLEAEGDPGFKRPENGSEGEVL